MESNKLILSAHSRKSQHFPKRSHARGAPDWSAAVPPQTPLLARTVRAGRRRRPRGRAGAAARRRRPRPNQGRPLHEGWRRDGETHPQRARPPRGGRGAAGRAPARRARLAGQGATQSRDAGAAEESEGAPAPAGVPGATPMVRKKFGRGRKNRCRFCTKDGCPRPSFVDYKDVPTLKKLCNIQGKMLSRRRTGNCAAFQHAARGRS